MTSLTMHQCETNKDQNTRKSHIPTLTRSPRCTHIHTDSQSNPHKRQKQINTRPKQSTKGSAITNYYCKSFGEDRMASITLINVAVALVVICMVQTETADHRHTSSLFSSSSSAVAAISVHEPGLLQRSRRSSNGGGKSILQRIMERIQKIRDNAQQQGDTERKTTTSRYRRTTRYRWVFLFG